MAWDRPKSPWCVSYLGFQGGPMCLPNKSHNHNDIVSMSNWYSLNVSIASLGKKVKALGLGVFVHSLHVKCSSDNTLNCLSHTLIVIQQIVSFLSKLTHTYSSWWRKTMKSYLMINYGYAHSTMFAMKRQYLTKEWSESLYNTNFAICKK